MYLPRRRDRKDKASPGRLIVIRSLKYLNVPTTAECTARTEQYCTYRALCTRHGGLHCLVVVDAPVHFLAPLLVRMGRACHSLHTRVYPGAYGTRTLFLHPCLAATTCRLLARLRCGCPGPDYNFLYPFSSGSSSSLPNRHALTGSDWALCHPLQTTHPRQGQTTRTGALMRKTPAPAACRRGRPHRLGPPPAGRRPPPLRMQPR